MGVLPCSDINRENRVNGIEYFNAGGHYYTTFPIAYDTIKVAKGDAAFAYDAAQKLALASQLPDMVWYLDAYAQYTHEGPFRFTAQEKARLNDVMSTMHNLAPEGNGTNQWLKATREDAGKFVSEAISQGDYLLAGFAIHKLGDSYAHIQMRNGEWVPYAGHEGHGGASMLGVDPDNIHVKPEQSIAFAHDLSARIASGYGVTSSNLGDVVSRGVANWTEAFEKSKSTSYNFVLKEPTVDYGKGNTEFINQIVEYETKIRKKLDPKGFGLEQLSNMEPRRNAVENFAQFGSAPAHVSQSQYDRFFGANTTNQQASNQIAKAYEMMLKRFAGYRK